jgi:hypothetical protein
LQGAQAFGVETANVLENLTALARDEQAEEALEATDDVILLCRFST